MEDKPAPPIACHLHKLTAAEREREKSLLNDVRKAAEIRDLRSGYTLRFPGDAGTVLALAEVITRERACCPCLDFELRCEAEGGAVSLSMTGREGVKQFLERLLIQ